MDYKILKIISLLLWGKHGIDINLSWINFLTWQQKKGNSWDILEQISFHNIISLFLYVVIKYKILVRKLLEKQEIYFQTTYIDLKTPCMSFQLNLYYKGAITRILKTNKRKVLLVFYCHWVVATAIEVDDRGLFWWPGQSLINNDKGGHKMELNFQSKWWHKFWPQF